MNWTKWCNRFVMSPSTTPGRGLTQRRGFTLVGSRARDLLRTTCPYANESSEVTLVFSGEEFPEPGTVAALKGRGHSVAQGGAAYLVHRYEEEPEFPKGLMADFTDSSQTKRAGHRSAFQ